MLKRGRSSTGRDDAARMAQTVTGDPGTDGKFHLKDACLYGGDTRLDRPYDLNGAVDRALRSREFREA